MVGVKIILPFLVLLSIVGKIVAQPALQPFAPRKNYGDVLEPVDKIYTGAGQSNPKAVADFVQATSIDPTIYMDYLGLSQLNSDAESERIFAHFDKIPKKYLLQLGLSMTRDGQPYLHYEHLLANTKDYDYTLPRLIALLKRLDRPVLLRLGYEFNGHWNGYVDSTFVLAWRKVVKAIRDGGLKDVATVWCMSADGDNFRFPAYYPGDTWVDWWSIDIFNYRHFAAPQTVAFLDSAERHKKPVLIGESTPRRIGVDSGQASWAKWFAPYFNLIRQRSGIKGFCYINRNWAGSPWPDWGNGNLLDNKDISALVTKELKQPFYTSGPLPQRPQK